MGCVFTYLLSACTTGLKFQGENLKMALKTLFLVFCIRGNPIQLREN